MIIDTDMFKKEKKEEPKGPFKDGAWLPPGISWLDWLDWDFHHQDPMGAPFQLKERYDNRSNK